MKLKDISDKELEKSVSEFLAKRSKKIKTHQKQLKRLHLYFQKNDINVFISKVIEKYQSKAYKKRWRSRNIQPQESLYWLLFDYACEYKEECSEKEYDEHGNEFTTALYKLGDFYIMRMDGQGSVVKIFKK